MTKRARFRNFTKSREAIRLAVILYVLFQDLLRDVEDLLHERGVDVIHETVRCDSLAQSLFDRERQTVTALYAP